jgi:hypothetical protein
MNLLLRESIGLFSLLETQPDIADRVNLDRIDNSVGYTESNCVPCCAICNITRNTLYTYEEFKLHIAPAIIKVRDERERRQATSSRPTEARASN